MNTRTNTRIAKLTVAAVATAIGIAAAALTGAGGSGGPWKTVSAAQGAWGAAPVGEAVVATTPDGDNDTPPPFPWG